ncbi:MAG: phosphoribosylaminoimidazolesuccinocarboxamide synthase [Actinophytocola sp.]|uniref:phosphoribosylaminoimidazolesuccinocarboxamide synthase n=1 Tax=Actinophytocola sp. TaxID=1872138 RepID=UPI001322CFD0|nr:phosphoribosylaminoimidazolesuccinocarboxamide synthase [Actinophytocola sp.]MPZ81553.1 phosphoribosylaminoimidazolesuccinocarboxamide synthase [Actinophytocola sp.]
MQHVYSGKVREIYEDGADLLLVASDRVSVYDVVLPTPIPDKGALLTQLSVWWFGRLADIVPNHLVSATDVPAEFAGRGIRCRRLEMVPFECIARGYLAGSGLREYQETGAISGVELPPGLVEGSRLPAPIFTPTTKVSDGGHDAPATFAQVAAAVGVETAERLRALTLAVYGRGAERAARNGIIVADTKLEFGFAGAGTGARAADTLTLADEVLTPDSSRFWPADDWAPGRPQHAYDKQFVRDWAAGTGWDKKPPAPELPAEVVAATQARYVDAYEKITGTVWRR